MQFNRNNFINILAMHQSNLDKKAIHPIFSSINIHSQENALKIISTDGQRYLEYTQTESLENFSIFINGTVLFEIIKKSKGEFFSIKETFDSYKVFVDNAEFKFAKPTEPKFPEWPNEFDHCVTLKANILLDAIKTVRWAQSNEENRPSLNGICFDFNESSLNLCATDTLKLSVVKIFKTNDFSGKWIVGKKSISEIVKILEYIGSTDIELSLGKQIQIKASKNNTEILWKSLCINGSFPNYEKLIQNKVFNASFVCDAESILSTIERIMLVSNQHQHTIILDFLENEPSQISAENAISAGQDILNGIFNGKKMKIMFDGKFLQEMLSNITGEIVFEINDPVSPVTIKKIENNGSFFILSPIRADI